MPEHLQLFQYLLLRASWKDRLYKGVQLKRGQLCTGRKALAKETGQKEISLYRRLEWLHKNSYIIKKSNNKMTIVTICNYDTYQDGRTTSEQQDNNEVTTREQQGNTIEELKEGKELKEGGEGSRYGEYKNVLFEKEQYQELIKSFPNTYEDKIKNLDEYLETNKSVKYDNHLLKIIQWDRVDSRMSFSDNSGLNDLFE